LLYKVLIMKKSILFISKSTFLSILFLTLCSVTFQSQALSKKDLFLGMPSTGDDLKTVKIKGPSVKMFKKADREMHLNMYNEINTAFSIDFDYVGLQNADIIINNQFAAGYQVFFSKNLETFADSFIAANFYAENISFSSSKFLEDADQSVNNLFYSEQ
jgi:hypothetical protein